MIKPPRTVSARVAEPPSRPIPSHLGGDEFGFLVECDTDGAAERVAFRSVLAAVRAPVTVGQHVIPTRGASGYRRPKLGQTPEPLIGDADMALILAKRSGVDRWVRSDDAASGDASAGCRSSSTSRRPPA